MQQPRWQLRRSAIRRLSAAPSPNKDLPVNHRNVTREFKIPRQRRRRKWRLKVNLRPYDQVVIISTRLLCQMQANSSGAESLATISKFRKKWKRKFRRHLSMSSIEREMRLFHVVVVQWCSCCLPKQSIAFLTFSLLSPSSHLKLPTISIFRCFYQETDHNKL